MKVAIIGAGNMGGAIARGLANGHYIQAQEISVSNPSAGKLDALKVEFPAIHVTHSNKEAAEDADIIIIAVKPWKVEEVLKPLRLRGPQILVSVAAGLTFEDLAHFVDPEMPMFRVIPNTAISEGASMTLIAARNASEEQITSLTALFNEMGRSMLIEEKQLQLHLADFLRHCLRTEIRTSCHAGRSRTGYQATRCTDHAGTNTGRGSQTLVKQRKCTSGHRNRESDNSGRNHHQGYQLAGARRIYLGRYPRHQGQLIKTSYGELHAPFFITKPEPT